MDITGKSKDDFTCPICMYIMVQPVTMPCKHSLCMMCYKQCVEKSHLACPICRLRISVWARRNSKANTLVDQGMWDTIQKLFPIEVKNQLEGKESNDELDSPNDIETAIRKIKDLSEPGAIRLEYEAALAKLQKQKEEEAKKEEEASAALIRALQEEEEEELSRLMRERKQLDQLGRMAAENLINQVENDNSHMRKAQEISKTPRSRNNSRNSNKEKRCESASTLKLDSYYNSYRKSSNSAPPYSEHATTLSRSQEMPRSGRGSRTDYSPYPYMCMSPSDKQPVSNNFPSDVIDEEDYDNLPNYLLSEHSYTSVSAERIDLTTQGDCEELSILRDDVQQFVKTEPPDLDEENPLPGGVGPMVPMSQVFQPIASSLRTPPKKLPSGEMVDPELIRTVPRSLTFCGDQFTVNKSSPSTSNCSSEILSDQNCFLVVPEKNETSTPNMNQTPLLSAMNQDRFTAHGDVFEKIKLTQRIVNATAKNANKKNATSSSVSFDQLSSFTLLPTSSSTKSASSTSTAMKGNICLSSTSTSSKVNTHPSSPSPTSSLPVNTSSIPVSSSLRCLNNNVLNNSKHIGEHESSSDYFITDNTQLVIPLDSDIKPIHVESYNTETHTAPGIDRSCRTPNENWMESNHSHIRIDTVHNHRSNSKVSRLRTSHSTQASKTKKDSKSKNAIGPMSSSLRDWCKAGGAATNKRTISADSSDSSSSFDLTNSNSSSKKLLTIEEADHLIALELQKKFNHLDKYGINGESNEYSLRKNKKRRLC